MTGFMNQLHTVLQAPAVMSKLHHLREISCDHVVVDADMGVLLALPSLTHLAVLNFDLSFSHVHKLCSWQELTVHGCFDVVGDLAKLPLQGLSRLVVGRLAPSCVDDWDGAMDGTAHDVAAALANVPASCHLTVHPDGRLVMDCGYGHRNEDLRQLLPVLARWEGVRSLTVDNDNSDDEGSKLLQPDTVTAIASQLANMPSCTTLKLDNWVPHLASPMLTALRPTHITRLVIGGYPVQEQHLVVWCSGDAGREITVEVCEGCNVRPKGGLQRVRAYLDQLRLNSLVRVTLLGEEIDDDSDDGSDDE
jgi:hypothetical protein